MAMYLEYMRDLADHEDRLSTFSTPHRIRIMEVSIPEPSAEVQQDNDAVINHISYHVHQMSPESLHAFPMLLETRVF